MSIMKRIPVSDWPIHKISELDENKINAYNELRHCYGSIEQYIVNDEDILVGVISSFDLENAIRSKTQDIKEVINYHYIKVVHNRFEEDMCLAIFDKSCRINSVPIVDEQGKICSIIVKLNKQICIYEEEKAVDAALHGMEIMDAEIRRLEGLYNKSVKVFTDIPGSYIYNLFVNSKICSDESLQSVDKEKDILLLAYLYDFNAINVVKKCIDNKVAFLTYNLTHKDVIAKVSPYFRIDKDAFDTLETEASFNGNYFDMNDFQNIFQVLKMTRNLKGDYVEIGTYRGDSARAALSYSKKAGIEKIFYFLDTYEGFSYDEAQDSTDLEWANTHTETSMGLVDRRLKEFTNYKLIKSNIISDGLPEEIKEIAVCNVDVDLYEAVRAALDCVHDKIVPGGVIIAEDYGHTPVLIGAQVAIRDFYENHEDSYYGIYLQSGQFLMIKKEK